MPFEVFQHKHSHPGHEATVTVTAKGHLSLSQSALNAIGQPSTVDLLFDRDERLIGIHPSNKPDGYRVSPSRVIHSIAFAHEFDIIGEQALRRPATLRDGMLVVDLNDPGTVVDSNRRKNR